MSDVIHIASRRPSEEVAAERFEAFRAASDRAQRTLDLQDGLVAGRAWKAFLDVFVGRPSANMVGRGEARS